VPKTATYTHAYAESNGFLTLLSDGERLTVGYALGPEAGEWLQQATLAIRARVLVEILGDVIQPFPSFSGIYDTAVKMPARRSRTCWGRPGRSTRRWRAWAGEQHSPGQPAPPATP
jgi:dihydrolipoamide dehydrogenase